ncbi:MAG: methionyl-tRNA formyltransferase [bacterium]|nr:methionyl-tRNA formyltransferase [bacterium]
MTDGPRIVFFGTPDFAVPSLQKLAALGGLKPIAVVTQPAQPVGRKAILTASPVQRAAEQLSIPLRAPRSIKNSDFLEWFIEQKPDIAVLVAYGKILPKEVLAVPRLGFVNVHPSLLPQHRGASPVAGALLAGDARTGITIMQLDDEMDHGPIFAAREVAIKSGATQGPLSRELALGGAALLADTLPQILSETLTPVEQNHAAATYTKLLKRSDGNINWCQPAQTIERLVRAYTPWPGSYTCLNQARIKIYQVALARSQTGLAPGQLRATGGKLYVGTSSDALEIKYLQMAGKKKQAAAEFINGHTNLASAKVCPCPPPTIT